ncbi:hypothetical protein GCM10022247_09540 [Allokutzneria multivorans]|uniref:Ricin B lectin domain-containing protein n=1 Tax=Allokutzneria multivorans TaxID=1142134 RepID=A0ABP7R4H0_9PSEU
MRTSSRTLAAVAAVVAIASTSPLASAAPEPVYKQLRSDMTKKCADVERKSLGDGARVHQWRCFSSVEGPHQEWEMKDQGGDDFKFVNKNSGKCLDVYDRSLERGMQAIQWACRSAGEPNQRWHREWVDASRGVFKLVNRNSGLCLDVERSSSEDGAHLHQWDCIVNAPNQNWVLKNANES